MFYVVWKNSDPKGEVAIKMVQMSINMCKNHIQREIDALTDIKRSIIYILISNKFITAVLIHTY